MPSVSLAGQKMPASPIRKLVPFSDAAKQRGIKVYHLNIGQPDIESPKGALQAVKDNNLNLVPYTHSQGEAPLRCKMAEYYKRWNIPVTADDIIVTNGGSEAILFAYLSCLNRGDEIIVVEPFYANYAGFASGLDINIIPVESGIADGFALPPLEEFEKKITPRTKAILICNPNNPTGYMYSEQELRVLAKIVKKYDLFLIADEVYREFTYDDHKYFSVMQLEGLEENAVLLDSVSKRYSACGCRIGMLVTRNSDVRAVAMKFAQARLCPPSYGQIFSEAAIDTPDSYFEAVKREYTLRRDILVEGINKIKGCYCPKPKGAFYAMASLPIDDSERFCKWLLEDFHTADNKTVMVAPATGFYRTPGSGSNQVRVSYVLKEEDLREALSCLEKALEVYPGREATIGDKG